ncbi:MAG: ATP-binding protein [Cryomorphaceae bacterium]|nr:MAG: ATP-binding protein [Cryomorphaceae bacterium]
MVLEIKLSNFFSVDEEVTLDMRAANINTQKTRDLSHLCFDFNDDQILKSAVIYGANASGKSNIIKAIRFCHAMVYESHKHNEDTNFNFMPFKFSKKKAAPSHYFIRFVAEGIEYAYSFSLTNTEIVKESLYYYPQGKKAKVFVRDESIKGDKRDKYSFAKSVIKRPFDVVENTSRKTLYISRASQMDREIPKILFNFFHNDFILRHSYFAASNIESLQKTHKTQLLKALQLADSDIVDFKVKVIQQPGKKVRVSLDTEELHIEDGFMEQLEIKTYHKFNREVPFDFFTEESLGTQKLFFMMMSIIDVLSNNKVLLIDEIEDSLHPKIIEYIIELFHRSERAQLIFTTHNTHILDLKRFRKDQIWFVNKKENGSSDLYSLYDYSDFRDTMDVEKAYLQGRFDSVPIVDYSSESLKHLMDE